MGILSWLPPILPEYELGIDIATEFVSRMFEGSIQTIQKCRWRLSTTCSCVLSKPCLVRLTPVQKRELRELGVTANYFAAILNWSDEERVITFANALFPNGSKRVRYNTRGRIALVEGTEESARRAVSYLGKNIWKSAKQSATMRALPLQKVT